ncbi:LAMI_0E01178g1_1 [Lachancea mirantina]|uniref:LAMI_0E01178g1_1 n=1 Tax=Lachancea mirantina TaxID=1230905 RepID=A0A1G4JIG4_9SACH|nr:LAMI_0E01178g1_1 [Lachancea mirantina]
MSSIEKFIAQQPLIVHSSLAQLRYLVLSEGLPPAVDRNTGRLRCNVWSVLTRCSMDGATSDYVSLMRRGPPPHSVYTKIKNDTFRTLNTDTEFVKRVPEDSITRCLSCYAWQALDSEQLVDDKDTFTLSSYVQGMNVLVAPLLYICPSEPMAYRLFRNLCHKHIPTYLDSSLTGVHNGAKLLDICVKIIDPKLSSFLADSLLTAEIYGIPSILTLSSCTRPLDQVCKLWDFMFAYGFHMNILFIVAQLVVIRAQILKSDSPMNLLRQFPEFDAEDIIRLGVGFVAKIPSNVYDLLVQHLTNPDIVIA